MIDYPVVDVDTDRLVDSVDYSEQSEVFSTVREDDATFDTECMKVCSWSTSLCYQHSLFVPTTIRN